MSALFTPATRRPAILLSKAFFLGVTLCGTIAAPLRWSELPPKPQAGGEPAATPPAGGQTARTPALPYAPTDRYEVRFLEGWRVLMLRDFLRDQPGLAAKTLKVLQTQLAEIARRVPSEAVARLRQITIWVEEREPHHPCMAYHPDPGWLKEHDMNPDKARCVEIANARNFLAWTIDQPWMVFHELAHGYHHQFLGGYDHPGLAEAHRQAVESQRYDSVLRIQGTRARAYALNDPMEYFAESSEAFFGVNDFYPFVRAELQQHDPQAFDLLAKLWGVAELNARAKERKEGSVPALSSAEGTTAQTIDQATLDKWSAPYRGWHYWPEHVAPATPAIPGATNILGTDVPTVYQLPGDPSFYMSFVTFDGRGYQSYVGESDDLLHWGNYRLAMGFGPTNEFDHGGCVIGAFLYESYDIRAPRVLKKRDGKFWTLYGAYPRQGGYELRPGYEGIAWSEDGLTWRRAKNAPILAVQDPDCAAWEQDCIYQPWLVEHLGRFFNFYNAAHGGVEQIGLGFSTDLLNWMRYPANPVVRNRAGGYDAQFCSDGKVFREGDHWTMFYFGVGRGGAHIMIAFSRDLVHWTAHPEPLYKAGGHPRGLDRQYAHKISLLFNSQNSTFYMFYNAVPGRPGPTGGRGIGLITSKPIPRPLAPPTGLNSNSP